MNVTESDLTVASAFYPILVECARQSPPRKVTYGELIALARERFPKVEAVQSAIPVSAGRRLDVVRMFLNKERLPDLTSLVVNASTGEVGEAFGANPERARDQVASFDWSAVATEFDLHIADLRRKVAARAKPRIERDEAKRLMSAYYREHRAKLPKEITARREAIIELIQGGSTPEDAFRNVAGSAG